MRAGRPPIRPGLRTLAALGLLCVCCWTPAIVHPESLDEESRACQSCHGIADWEIQDPVAKRTVFLSIDTDAYQRSSHGSLGCVHCHAPGYDDTPPHQGSRGHPLYLCVLCHQKDRSLDALRLPERKAALQRSVHGRTEEGPLDCHRCHDPHTFRPINDERDALRRIENSNAICLECHSTEIRQRDAESAHDLFPNYENHLRKVKCIACHTPNSDSTHHRVTSKNHAVKECSKCHTPSSPTLDIMYGPQRAEQGNSLTEDAYVIGSARSPRLERLSVILFLALLGAIGLHALARFIHVRRKKSIHEP